MDRATLDYSMDWITNKDMHENIGLYEHLGWRVVKVDGAKVGMIKQLKSLSN